MKDRTEKIVDELKYRSNQSKSFNVSSLSAIHFMEHSISEATEETKRADNLRRIVKLVSNKTQNAQTMVDNHTKIIEDLSNNLSEFNNGLNRTRIQIVQDNIRVNAERNEIENIKVTFTSRILLYFTSGFYSCLHYVTILRSLKVVESLEFSLYRFYFCRC